MYFVEPLTGRHQTLANERHAMIFMRSVARTRANHGLLNLFPTRGPRADQRARIFSSIFAMVEAVGTLRINRLLRGNKYVNSPLLHLQRTVDGVRSLDTAEA